MMITRIWTDHEIIGRIYLQVLRLQVQNLFENEEKDKFFHCLSALMHKLHATKYHMENYQQIEKREHHIAGKRFKKNPNSTVEAFELIFELEGFLFQVKSSLDMLVKLLNPIIGAGYVKTSTFGNKGESIIRGLEQYKKKKEVIEDRVDKFIDLIQNDKDNWLEKVIDFRDELNHFKGLQDFKFVPGQLPNKQIIPLRPKFKGLEVVPFIQAVYKANLEFSQDFICGALSMRMPQAFLLGMDSGKESKEYFDNMPGAEFARYAWFLNNSSVKKAEQINPADPAQAPGS